MSTRTTNHESSELSTPYPRRWAALGVLAAGLSMIVLDGTIVGVALPTIITDLKLDLTQAQWVNAIYSVVFAALLLSAGRLGDRWGRRRMFQFGVVVFLLGSLMAGLATSADPLITARVIQGIGGAFILPTTLSAVNTMFQDRERAAAFGVWGAVMAGMAAIGPLLGGWITSAFSWEWIFLVNVPIGVAILIATQYLVPETSAGVLEPGADVDGFQLSALAFGALVFAAIEGPTLGWWKPKADLSIFGWTWTTDAPISIVPLMGAIGLVSLALFIIWERHRARVGRSALLDLSLFKHTSFSWGNVTAGTVAIGEFALVFVLPLFLVNAMAMSVLEAGMVLSAMAAGAFVAGSQARRLATRLSAANVVLLGLALEVAGVVILALVIHPSLSPWLATAPLLVYGIGLGFASAQLTSLVLSEVPTAQSGQGSATQSTVRQLGAAIGAAVAGTLLSLGLGQTLDTGTRYDALTRTTGGSVLPQLRAQGADAQLIQLLTDGFADATRWAILGSAVFLLLGLLGAFQVRRAASRKAPDLMSGISDT
ncbi:MAG TPA: MFS transporter [Marmoricola sp.]|nr:MFS transporter [Marmoricola sp.]HNI70447.1 MFS transporter [Marmoricola sp.]HNO39221.1 MFS transporter [Marmoricola sp.]